MTTNVRNLIVLSSIVAASFLATSSCSGDDVAVPSSIDAGVDASQADSSIADAQLPDARTVNDAGLNIKNAAEGPIEYWGGPVMTGIPNVYFIWYGDWASNSAPMILEDLIKNFSSTPYSNILSSYFEEVKVPTTDAGAPDTGANLLPHVYVTGNVSFMKSVYVGYTHGLTLFSSDIEMIVAEQLRAHSLQYDANGIYFVFTSKDVSESGTFGFCGSYCGWHRDSDVDGTRIKYAFVGDGTRCLDACTIQPNLAEMGITKGPNDNWAADGMASVMIHELSETLTDPLLNNSAWLDNSMQQENGDMCAWRFEPTTPSDNGSRGNVRFGSRDYLIQQMWVIDDAGGRCDLKQ